jgi:hypothetical protein
MVSVLCGLGAAAWQVCCPDSATAAACGHALAAWWLLRDWWHDEPEGESP